jgi:hypothetical protein
MIYGLSYIAATSPSQARSVASASRSVALAGHLVDAGQLGGATLRNRHLVQACSCTHGVP